MSAIAATKPLAHGKYQLIKSRLTPWIVCLSAALFFLFEFVQLNMFNTIGAGLEQTFHIDAPTLADISNKYFLANIIFLFPAGLLLDRISTRKAIVYGMLLSILCTFGFAMAHALWQLKLARFITGIAGSFCFLSCVRLASRWFQPKRMALIVGFMVTIAMLGGMIAQTPLLILVQELGWRSTLLINGVFGLTLLLLILLFVKDHPPTNISTPTTPSHHCFWQVLIRTIKRRQNWLCGLYTSLMNLPIFLLGAIWGVLYLTQVRHFSAHLASFATLMLFLGVIIGSPIMGWLSDYIERRKLPMAAGALLSLLIILCIMLLPTLSATTAVTLFFSIGFLTSTQIIGYPLIAESNPYHVTATAEGMASVLIMAGGFSQNLFALLMQRHWDHTYVAGIPFYAAHNYLIGLSIMPIAFVLSFTLVFFLRESYCKPYRGEYEH